MTQSEKRFTTEAHGRSYVIVVSTGLQGVYHPHIETSSGDGRRVKGPGGDHFRTIEEARQAAQLFLDQHPGFV